MDEERMITVPYDDFVDGMKAMADLYSIRAMLASGATFASDAIMVVLGLEKRNDTANRY